MTSGWSGPDGGQDAPDVGYPQPGYPGSGPGYGPGYPGSGYYGPPQLPRHPDALTALVLGIVGVVALPVTGPFAWWLGNRARNDIAANRGRWSGEDMAKAGFVLGIIGTVFCAFFVVGLLIFFVVAVGAATG